MYTYNSFNDVKIGCVLFSFSCFTYDSREPQRRVRRQGHRELRLWAPEHRPQDGRAQPKLALLTALKDVLGVHVKQEPEDGLIKRELVTPGHSTILGTMDGRMIVLSRRRRSNRSAIHCAYDTIE